MRRPNRREALLAVLVGVLMRCGSGPAGPESAAPGTPAGVVQVGAPLPRVQGTAVDGASIDSRQWRGRVQVLFFWALYCRTCLGGVGDLAALQHMQSSFGAARMNVVTINPIDDRGELREVQAAHQYTYPFIADEDRALWRRFGQLGLPSVYVVDGAGIVRYRAEGFDAFVIAGVVRALQR